MKARNRNDVPRAAIAVLAAELLVGAMGCNVIDAVIGGDVAIAEMLPGQSVGGETLDCWLTLDFKRLPEGVRPTDVRVRFESIALTRPAEFDWNYIASRDVVRAGERFGSGYRDLTESKPGSPPPLGIPIKVKFPLPTRTKIENAPSKIWLEAKVFWGGEEQTSMKRHLEHAYSRRKEGFF
jgi:hypothetical protein